MWSSIRSSRLTISPGSTEWLILEAVTGTCWHPILKSNPQMRGVVYDLPEVVFGGAGSAHFDGCQGRVEFEAGSFFDRVPSGCDAYIMKFILHDWSDDHCRKILGLIREQLPPHGRVLVCEQVLDPAPKPSPAKLLDIEMLAMTVGGRERTAAEFSDLFASAGLRLVTDRRDRNPRFAFWKRGWRNPHPSRPSNYQEEYPVGSTGVSVEPGGMAR